MVSKIWGFGFKAYSIGFTMLHAGALHESKRSYSPIDLHDAKT